jgi:hypothetical protein
MDYGHETHGNTYARKYVHTGILPYITDLQRKFKTTVYRIVGGLYRNELDWRVKGSGIESR